MGSQTDRPAAFDAEMVAALPNLGRYALSLARHRQAAQDLVQDTITKAMTHWRGWMPGTDMRAWLFTIMRNAHLDDVRRVARRIVESEIDVAPVAALRIPPNQIAVDVGHDLERIAARLRPSAARLLAHAFEGMTYDQMAEIEGCPVGTVRSRLARARPKARRLLR